MKKIIICSILSIVLFNFWKTQIDPIITKQTSKNYHMERGFANIEDSSDIRRKHSFLGAVLTLIVLFLCVRLPWSLWKHTSAVYHDKPIQPKQRKKRKAMKEAKEIFLEDEPREKKDIYLE